MMWLTESTKIHLINTLSKSKYKEQENKKVFLFDYDNFSYRFIFELKDFQIVNFGTTKALADFPASGKGK